MLCGGAVFLLAGDQIISGARLAYGRWVLSGRQAELALTVSDDTTPVRFRVESGESPFAISRNLIAQNLVTDGDLFFDFVRYEGYDRRIASGTYFLNRALTIPEIAEALTDSRWRAIDFRVAAGWRIEQVAEAITSTPRLTFSAEDFLRLARNPAQSAPAFAQWAGIPPEGTLEGFLLPGAYELPPTASAQDLIDILLAGFRAFATDELTADAQASDLSWQDVVTLASIVQREALHADEMPLIAGVYLNRLRIGMRLDADPTVQYALHNTRGGWWPRITLADYQGVVSPYNTYRTAGLPPTAIANPGMNALRAVIYPTPSEYFFFRADCRADGYHDFARTYEEHLANGC